MMIHHEGVPIGSFEEWAQAVAGSTPSRWRPGDPGYDMALAWCPPDRPPGLPAELRELLHLPGGGDLDDGTEPGRLEILQAEPLALGRDTPGATLRMDLHSGMGPVAGHVLAWGDAPFGLRVEGELRTAVQEIARGQDSDRVETIRSLARTLLPPTKPGLEPLEPLEPLGTLRWELLRQVGEARTRALEAGTDRVLFVVHEIVSLGGTRESRRRNNREDLDRFVRRLSGGSIPRLQRGVVAGPVSLPGGVELYLGKARRDLP